MKFLTNFQWKLGWQLHKMCPNSPLAPKKKTSAGRFAASFIVSGKKIDMLRTPRTMAHFWHHTHNFKMRIYFLQTQRKKVDKEPEKNRFFFAKNHFLTCMIFFTVTYFNGFLTIKIVSNQKKIKLHKRFCYFSFGGLWRNVY